MDLGAYEFQGNPIGEPLIAIEKNNLHFWYQPAGNDTTLTVEVYNHGNNLLSLNSLGFNEGTNFTCESFGSAKKLSDIKFRSIAQRVSIKSDPILDIQAHQIDSLLIRFTSNTGITKKYTDLMSIYSNAQEDLKINLKGYGLLGTVIYGGAIGNMTWTPAGNPYHIIGDIEINETLTIQPGVNVLVQNYEKINVPASGKLLAIGTASLPIHFSSGETELFADNTTKDGGWGGIRFLYSGNNDILDHCIIENGKKSVAGYYFSGDENSMGGAVYALNSSPNITNSSFMNNNASNGGAISLIGSSTYAQINNCRFENNNATNGGGIYDQQSNSQVILSTFLSNQAGGKGGAIYSERPSGNLSYGETLKIIGNTIKNNRSSYGGGISVLKENPYLESNIITNNNSDFGGGLYLDFCNSKIINNTIADNSASTVGAGVYVKDLSVPKFTNCIIFGNTAPKYVFTQVSPSDKIYYRIPYILLVDENKQIISHSYYASSMMGPIEYFSKPEFDYCNIQGEDRHIIQFTEEPSLSEPTKYPRNAFIRLYYKNVECYPDFDKTNYSLKATSPCIDLGKFDMPEFTMSEYDALNNPRIKTGTNIDLGACEFQNSNIPKPVLTHTVDEIDFGKVFAEQTKSSKLYFCNSGNTKLEISGQTFEDVTGNFELSSYENKSKNSFDMKIDVHERDSLMVTFNPTDSVNAYYLDAIISSGTDIVEKRLPLTGEGVVQPDLIVTEVEIPPAVNSGESFEVKWKVKNIGVTGTDVSQWKDRIYLTQAETTEEFILEQEAATKLGEFDNLSYLLPRETYGNTATVILPDGMIGNYHVAVMADCKENVSERNENNNKTASELGMDVSLTLPPDLSVTSLLLPSDAESGSLLHLSWTTSNKGDNPTSVTSKWNDKVYFSVDSVLNSKSTLLYTYVHTGQLSNTGPDSTYTVSTDVRLPHKAQGIHTAVDDEEGTLLTELGNCYIHVFTDKDDDVEEYINEGNNSATKAIRLLLTPPDYEVIRVNVPDTTVYSGKTFDVQWFVRNNGPGVNNPYYEKNWEDRLYISPDDYLNKDDSMVKDAVLCTHYLSDDNLTYYYDEKSKVILDSVYTVVREVRVPEGYDGNYFIFAEADCNDDIFEYDEVFQSIYNNIGEPSIINVALTPPPDLYVNSITVPAHATAGYPAEIIWEVINADNALTDRQWDDNIYISSSAVFDKTKSTYLGKSLADYSGRIYGANETYSRTVTVNIPNNIYDRKYIHIVTDAANTVYEHNNENNNISTAEILIDPYPEIDLALTSFDAPVSAYSGNQLQVNWTVENTGSAPTISTMWYDGIYLSEDEVCDTENDIQLGKFVHYGKLDTAAVYMNNKTVYLPDGIEGVYYLMVKTDITAVNADTDRINNVSLNTVIIERKPYPDTVIDELIVTPVAGISKEKLVVPTDVTSGQPVEISWKVSNGSDIPTQSEYWYDAVYLSKDTLVTSDDTLLRVTMRDRGLGPNESYEVDIEEYLPSYASGIYYVILKTDVWDTMYEELETNNIEYAPVNIKMPMIVDLTVKDIIIPESADAGDPVTVEYTIVNEGINTAAGWLTDGVYFSTDQALDADDPLMGLNKHYIVLDPEESVKMSVVTDITRSFDKEELQDVPVSEIIGSKGTGSLFSGQLPGVLPGDYYALVKVDMRNNIREDDLTNNTGYSLNTIAADFSSVIPGVAVNGTLSYGGSKYYKLSVDSGMDGKDFRFDLSALSKDDAPVEIYIAYERIPQLYDFDFSSTTPFEAYQQILLPEAREGKYYIRLYCPAVPLSGDEIHSFSLIVNEMIFSIQDINPAYGGTGGDVTCRIRGASFKDSLEVYLYNGEEMISKAVKTETVNSTELKVKWRLTDTSGNDLQSGIYDLVVVKVGEVSYESTVLKGAFEIQQQRIEMIANRLAYPENLRRVQGTWGTLPANPAYYTYIFKNNGNVDIPYLRADIKISDNVRIISVHSEKLIQLDDHSEYSPYYVYGIDNGMSFDNDEAYEIPLLGKDISPQEYVECKISFTDYTGLAVNSAVNLECIGSEEFISRFDANALNIRDFVLKNSEYFPTDFIISAYNYEAFKEGLYGNAVEMGILSPDWRTDANPVQLDQNSLNLMWEYTPDINSAIATNIAYGYGDLDEALDYFARLSPDSLGRKTTVALGALLPNDLDTTEPMLMCDEIVGSFDPNDMSGTPGYGEDHYVRNDRWLNYNIQFENDPYQATAPASVVNIRQKLSKNVDPRDFRIQDFGFGKYQFTVDENTAYYTKRLDLRDSLGVFVDFVAGLDMWTSEIFFEYRTIDPSTGSVPVDPLKGFLAINDSLGNGQGYVNYKILPKTETVTGDTVRAVAKIVFDDNAPISTPEWYNILDAGRPVSRVDSLENYKQNIDFSVYWSGEDDSLGSGIKDYSIYISKNGMPFELWIENTTDTSAVYNGNAIDTYEFFCIAEDNVGFVEPMKNYGEGAITGNVSPQITGLDDIKFNEDTEYSLNLNDILIDEDEASVAWIIRKTDSSDSKSTSKLLSKKGSKKTYLLTENTPSSIKSIKGEDSLYVIVDNDLKTAVFKATPNYYIADVPFEFIATDNTGLAARDTALVSVLPVNDAPVLSMPFADDTKDEDFEAFTLDLSSYFSDVDNAVLSYSVSYDNAQVNCSVTGNLLSVKNILNWNGVANISITATDGQYDVSDAFVLTVNPVNDVPYITEPFADLTVDEDFAEFNIDLGDHFADIDNGTLYYSVSVNAEEVNCAVNGNILILNSVKDWYGSSLITVTVSDTYSKSSKSAAKAMVSSLRSEDTVRTDNVRANVSDTFALKVNAVNDAPVLVSPIPDDTRDEDFESFTLDLNEHFSDVDNATLTYTAAFNASEVTYTIADNILTVNSVLNWNGAANISITATDGQYDVSDAFILTVNPVNDVPNISEPLADLTVDEDFAEFTINLNDHFDDLDGDELYYSVNGNNAEVISAVYGSILTINSVLNWNGKSIITVTANDRINKLSVTDSFEITVNAVNDAPVLATPIHDATRDEDFEAFTLDLNEHFSDVDNATLTYTAAFNAEQVSCEVTDNILTVNSVLNWNGTANISITATDGEYEVSDAFILTVNPINDVPNITQPLADLTVDEDFADITINLNDHFSDLDGDVLIYSVTGNNAEVISIVSGNILTISSVLNWNGKSTITVTANDRVNKLSVSDTFEITVNAVNDAPVLATPIHDATRDEDFEAFTLDLNEHFSDVDNATLTYTAAFNAEQVSCEVTDNILTVNSVLNWNGAADISITATDGQYDVSDEFVLTVNPVNDVPNVSVPLADLTVDEDFATFSINLNDHFADLDGDVLYYSVTGNNAEVVSAISDNTLTISSVLNWNGKSIITVTANDRVNKLSVSDTFDITVNAINDAPVLATPIPDETRDEDFEAFTLDLNTYFSDVDNATLTYSASFNAEQVSCEVTDNILTVNSVLNWNGAADISITATDGQYDVSDEFVLTVNPVNDVPNVSVPLADLTVDEDFATFSINLNDHFADLDGDVLYYSVTGNNAEVVSTIDKNILSISSVLNWNGVSTVTVTANDRVNKLSVSDTFDITVNAINDAPVLAISIPDATRDEDFEAFTLDLNTYFSDVDNAVLTYSAAFNTEQVSCEVTDNILTVNSVLNWNGAADISITATDGQYDVSDEFVLTVNPVNDVPNVSVPLADLTVDEDFATFSINLNDHFADLDGDVLYYSVAGNNAEVISTISGNTLTISSVLNWNGVSTITVTANDRVNKLSVTDSFEINVNAVNDAPVLVSPIPDDTRDEDFESFTLDLNTYFSDVDNATLTYSATFNKNEVSCEVTDNILTVTSVLNWNGVANISITATDGQYEVSDAFALTVTPVNDAPMIALPEYIEFLSEETVVLDLHNHLSDIDNTLNELVLTWTGNNGIVLNRTDSLLIISAKTPYTYCREAITFTVDDCSKSISTKATASQTITTRCAPEFDPPNIKKLIGNSVKVFQDMRLHLQVWEKTGMEYVDAEYTVNGVTEKVRMECLNALEQEGYTYPDSCGLKLYQFIADIPEQGITSFGRVKFYLEDVAGNITESHYYLITWQKPTENFKYVEGFEGDIYGSGDWFCTETDNDSLTWYQGSKPYTGYFNATCRDTGNTGENYLISPEIKLASKQSHRVVFKAQGYNSRLRVMVSESPDMNSFTDIVYDGAVDGEYSEIECDLTRYSKKNIYLAWVQSGDEDTESSISIDDVIVIEYLTKSSGDENLVRETALHQNYPNPFNNSTMICFDLLDAGNVEIKVYNYQGQLVRTVADRHFEQGKYKLEWDGKSDRGESVSSGVYIYQMTTGGYTKIRKMVFTK